MYLVPVQEYTYLLQKAKRGQVNNLIISCASNKKKSRKEKTEKQIIHTSNIYPPGVVSYPPAAPAPPPPPGAPPRPPPPYLDQPPDDGQPPGNDDAPPHDDQPPPNDGGDDSDRTLPSIPMQVQPEALPSPQQHQVRGDNDLFEPMNRSTNREEFFDTDEEMDSFQPLVSSTPKKSSKKKKYEKRRFKKYHKTPKIGTAPPPMDSSISEANANKLPIPEHDETTLNKEQWIKKRMKRLQGSKNILRVKPMPRSSQPEHLHRQVRGRNPFPVRRTEASRPLQTIPPLQLPSTSSSSPSTRPIPAPRRKPLQGVAPTPRPRTSLIQAVRPVARPRTILPTARARSRSRSRSRFLTLDDLKRSMPQTRSASNIISKTNENYPSWRNADIRLPSSIDVGKLPTPRTMLEDRLPPSAVFDTYKVGATKMRKQRKKTPYVITIPKDDTKDKGPRSPPGGPSASTASIALSKKILKKVPLDVSPKKKVPINPRPVLLRDKIREERKSSIPNPILRTIYERKILARNRDAYAKLHSKRPPAPSISLKPKKTVKHSDKVASEFKRRPEVSFNVTKPKKQFRWSDPYFPKSQIPYKSLFNYKPTKRKYTGISDRNKSRSKLAREVEDNNSSKYLNWSV